MKTGGTVQSLWGKRRELPELSRGGTAAALVLLGGITVLQAIFGWWLFPFGMIASAIAAGLLLFRRTFISYIAPLIPLAAALFCTKDVFLAALIGVAVPVGIVLAAAVFLEWERAYAAVAAAAAGCAVLVVILVIYAAVHSLSVNVFADRIREAVSAWLAGLRVFVRPGESMQLFTEESADYLAQYFLCILPALLFWTSYAYVLVVMVILRGFMRYLDVEADFLPNGWKLRCDRLWIGFFCLSHVCSLLLTSTENAFVLCCAVYNVYLVLLMPAACGGCSALIERVWKSESVSKISRIAIVCLGVLLLMTGVHWCFMAAAYYGVYTVLRGPRN